MNRQKQWNAVQRVITTIPLGLYSLIGRTCYRKISWSLQVERFEFRRFKSLCNLTGTSAATLCDSNFTWACSERSNSQYVSFGSGSGLVTNMWPVIIWTSVDKNPWSFMASLYLNMWGVMSCNTLYALTHLGRVRKLTSIGLDYYYLDQCWNIVNSNLRNKLQWNHQSIWKYRLENGGQFCLSPNMLTLSLWI